MASKLKEWDFSRTSNRESKYPWDKWTDGEIWKVEAKKDFTCKPASFRSALQTHADKIEKKVRASVRDEFVVFQFHEDAGE